MKNKAALITTGILFCAALLIGAVSLSRNARESIPPQDSWFKIPTGPLAASDREKYHLPDSEFYAVRPEMQDQAVGMLQSTSSLPVNQATVRLFCPQAKPVVKGTTPFLVRGLAVNEGTGGYEVWSKPGDLWIEHSSLGRGNPPMLRRPQIVFLKQKPKNVFVTCGIGAE